MGKKNGNEKPWQMPLGSMSHPMVAVIGALVVIVGLFIGLGNYLSNRPVTYEETTAYSASFERFHRARKYAWLKTTDGNTYSLHPHILSEEQFDELEALEAGTPISFCVSPRNDYIVELKAGGNVILDFDATQKALQKDAGAYVIFGIVVCIGGIYLILCPIIIPFFEKKEKEQQKNKKRKRKKRKH